MADSKQGLSEIAERLGVNPSDPAIRRDLETLKASRSDEPAETSILIWALALAFGVAGALAWEAPVVAFFWPLGFGGASLSLAAVAWTLGERPSWAILAVLAGCAALGLGVVGLLAIEDARQIFE